jgi:hypothetical protein
MIVAVLKSWSMTRSCIMRSVDTGDTRRRWQVLGWTANPLPVLDPIVCCPDTVAALNIDL